MTHIITRDANEIMLLRSIIENQPISRADLAKLNKLNKTTTSAIINQLLDEHLVFESGVGSSTFTGGRKPILLEFNPKAAVVISIELGENYIRSAFSYLDGQLIHHDLMENVSFTSESIYGILVTIINGHIGLMPTTPNGLVGITIAVHGVALNNKLTFSPFYDLDDIELADMLRHQFKCPVYIENEANLAAIGEYTFSTDKDRIVNVNIKTGIGAGIIQFGTLLKGTHGRFGEIGHTIIFPGGRPCPCGNLGCLERYASTKALMNSIKNRTGVQDLDIETIVGLWEDKNEVIVDEITMAVDYLSVGINNLITSFDPDEIIINSMLFNKIPLLINLLSSKLKSRITKETKLSVSKLTDKATLYGGIAVVTSDYLCIENLKFLDNVYL